MREVFEVLMWICGMMSLTVFAQAYHCDLPSDQNLIFLISLWLLLITMLFKFCIWVFDCGVKSVAAEEERRKLDKLLKSMEQ